MQVPTWHQCKTLNACNFYILRSGPDMPACWLGEPPNKTVQKGLLPIWLNINFCGPLAVHCLAFCTSALDRVGPQRAA